MIVVKLELRLFTTDDGITETCFVDKNTGVLKCLKLVFDIGVLNELVELSTVLI